MKYISLVHVDGHTMWITEGQSNNPRFFDDETLATETAKVLSPNFKIMTEDEWVELHKNGK